MPEEQPGRTLHAPGLGSCRLVGRLFSGDAGELWNAAGPTIDGPDDESGSRTTLVVTRPGEAWAAWRVRLEQVARLEHLGWATPQSVGRTPDDQVFAVYDRPESTSLSEWAQPERPLRERLVVIARLATSLTHAHARGVHHEHLSPACILMVGQTPAIVDTPIGQPAHAEDPWAVPDSPSVRRAETPAGVDIARLGAGLFWMLTGRPIADTESADQDPAVLLRVQGVSDELISVICKATGIGATPRYLQICQFEQDITRVLARGGLIGRGRVRNSMSALTAAAVALLGLGTLIGYVTGSAGRAAALAASAERTAMLQTSLAAREAELAETKRSHERHLRAIGSVEETLRFSRYSPGVSANRLASWSMLEMLMWPVDGPGSSLERRINFHEARVTSLRTFIDHSYATSSEDHLDTILAELSLAAWEMQLGRPANTVAALEKALPKLEQRLEPSDPLLRGGRQLMDFASATLRGETPEEQPDTETWVIHIAGNRIPNLQVEAGEGPYREPEPLMLSLSMRQTDSVMQDRDREFTERMHAKYLSTRASAPGQ